MLFFTAGWSTSGRLLQPVLRGLAARIHIGLTVLDVGDRPELVRQYALKTLPTTILVDRGREIKRWMGLRPETEVMGALATAISDRAVCRDDTGVYPDL